MDPENIQRREQNFFRQEIAQPSISPGLQSLPLRLFRPRREGTERNSI